MTPNIVPLLILAAALGIGITFIVGKIYTDRHRND